ncbi:MAG: MerR family transcriptional regulator [Corynebacterium casei]|nr:MerR family transcriptional regulator [Corynebacterium casei]MDN6673985.1 MerR family transcriptional regulator [Corynebacterium casei]HCJ67859.1 MerR family transcriptional regulator [Corynebacterium casei]
MRIGEMAETTGVSARMLRYYEKLGLIEPGARTSAGYRIYDDADLERVFHIEGLRGLGLSLTEVKSALDDPDHRIAEVIDELIAESRARLREEKRLFEQLLAVRGSDVTDWRAALNVMNLLKNLRSHDPAARQDSALRLAPAAHPRMVARSAIAEKDLNVAGALSWSMLQAGDVALEEVSRALASADKEVRMRAVRILAEAAARTTAGTKQSERSEEVFEHLRGALDDEDTDIRAVAALSLGERGVLVAFDELLRMIVDGDHDVQASEVLAQSPSWHEAALDTIGALLNDDRTQEQRARLVQALAEFEDSDELLLVLLDDPTPVVALTAKAIVRTRGNMP